MKLTLILLFALICSSFAAIDSIGGGKNIEKFITTFALYEDDMDRMTELSSIVHVENGIVYGNQEKADDAFVIIDVRAFMPGGDTSQVNLLGKIDRAGSNSEYNLPSQMRGDTLITVDSTDLVVYDLSTVATPVELHRTIFPAEIKDVVWYKRDSLLIWDNRGYTSNSFHILNISDNTKPLISASLKKVNYGNYGVLSDGVLTQLENDWLYLMKTPITERYPEYEVELPYKASDILAKSFSLYASIPTIGIVVYDYSNIENIVATDTLDGGGNNLFIHKNLLVSGGGVDDSISIFDISNPDSIEKVAFWMMKAYKKSYQPFAVDTVTNYLYASDGYSSWMNVLDISSYLKSSDTTYKNDTTHTTIFDTTTTIDTNLVAAAPDTLLTTVEKEYKIDSLFITNDTLVNKISIGTGSYSAFDTLLITTLDSTIDTLGGTSLVTPVHEKKLTIGNLISLKVGEKISDIVVMDVRGRVVSVVGESLHTSGLLSLSTPQGGVLSQGIVFVRIVTNQRIVMKKVRL